MHYINETKMYNACAWNLMRHVQTSRRFERFVYPIYRLKLSLQLSCPVIPSILVHLGFFISHVLLWL